MHADYESKARGDGFPSQDRLALAQREISSFERTLVHIGRFEDPLISFTLER